MITVTDGGRRAAAIGSTTLALALAATVAPAGAATYTFDGDLVTIPAVGAATPYPAAIDVSGVIGTVTDVDALIENLGHGAPEDIDMLLVAPNGVRKTLLMSDRGGVSAAAFKDLTFDDAAAGFVPDPLASGAYKPSDTTAGNPDTFPAPAPAGPYSALPMSVFNGIGSRNGAWNLFVVDDAGPSNGGLLAKWSLKITTTNGAPVAEDDSYHTPQDTTLTVAAPGYLTNDHDPDGDPVHMFFLGNPSHGGVAVSGPHGDIVYTPDEDFVGTDSFHYQATDGALKSNVATVAVTVTANCGGLAPTITGTAGPDTLTGTPGPDVIAGGAGDDTIHGLSGNDVICAGSGTNVLDGGSGHDVLIGGSGSDTLRGVSGNDQLDGGGSVDSCDGGSGIDTATPACESQAGIP